MNGKEKVILYRKITPIKETRRRLKKESLNQRCKEDCIPAVYRQNKAGAIATYMTAIISE